MKEGIVEYLDVNEENNALRYKKNIRIKLSIKVNNITWVDDCCYLYLRVASFGGRPHLRKDLQKVLWGSLHWPKQTHSLSTVTTWVTKITK